LNSGSNDLLHILKPSAEAPEKLRVLLAAGANPSAKDEGGHFAMEIFSLRGYYSLVQALHKQTGFARLNNSLIMCCWRRSHFVGRHGSRPLRESHSAASGHDWNFVKTIKYLLCAKAEFANPTLTWNATDGSFLLRGCVWARHSVEALDLLLDHNAEIDGKSERARHQELDTGATVLHCAASDDRLDLVQRLLSKFTDPRHMTKTMITCMNQKKDTVIATTNAIATSTSLPRCICDIISEYNIHSGFDTESSEVVW
jgi:ankyrin repeat protein